MKIRFISQSAFWSMLIKVMINEQNQNFYEAHAWLKQNRGASALASNRFGFTEVALKFVEELYHLGAKEVFVSGILDEPWRLELEGGPYATQLIVRLPDEPKQKRQILDLWEKEFFEQMGNKLLEEDINNVKVVNFWWD